MDNLLEYASKAINEYGIKGDNSFEYIGVTIDNSISFKVYRKKKETALKYLENIKPYSLLCKILSEDFLTENKLSICDFSKGLYKDKETYRLVCSLEDNQNITQAEKVVEKFLVKVGKEAYISEILSKLRCAQEVFNTDRSLLMQLGIEVDEECKLIGIKYYAEIKTSNQILDTETLSENVARIWTTESNKIYAFTNFLRVQEFEPIFVGVNLYDDEMETKLYFKSTAFGFQTKKIVECTNNVFREYKLNQYISEYEVASLYKMNVFVRGIAIDLSNFDKWRLYINALPRKIV